ncbi:hypothetical protein GWI33_007845 [Rhynchophorus ferrugineus]|uniref:Uncharacterized protein n=1 Tax=Rhynchophorus ferrugineus TaxID=354439 RepID=A0A834IHW8_RHYFE|nr:hypothetical protein GWI33_007845 [Rhynchophorus ferrugineus]
MDQAAPEPPASRRPYPPGGWVALYGKETSGRRGRRAFGSTHSFNGSEDNGDYAIIRLLILFILKEINGV